MHASFHSKYTYLAQFFPEQDVLKTDSLVDVSTVQGGYEKIPIILEGQHCCTSTARDLSCQGLCFSKLSELGFNKAGENSQLRNTDPGILNAPSP